ncbi:HTH_Tnp_Tc3_2 domain-containing protein [Trichonephila clavipes]|nr:HTH_Tnp_Tc3_2 domain-containing protein [Trichonephila clavipes]
MPLVRGRNAPQYVSDFDKGQIIECPDCGLSYRPYCCSRRSRSNDCYRIWNRWVQDGNTEHRAGSGRPPITSSREERHVTRMTLMDRAATSRAPSQELGSFARQKESARTV